MKAFLVSISSVAASLGGVGLFVIALLDSSFVSLPLANDSLVVLMVLQKRAWMPYYAAMATLGSVAGCYVIYFLAKKGGEGFVRRRLKEGHINRALEIYRRHGLLALMVPALLPPPAPFKLFVLIAGIGGIGRWQFIGAIAAARGARYLALGTLALVYGDQALEVMRTRGVAVALGVVAAIVIGGIAWYAWQRRMRTA